MANLFELDPVGPAPVFVLSHERSGSTLLRIVLDTHSQLACPSELTLAQVIKQLLFAFEGTLGVAFAELRGPENRAALALQVRAVVNGFMKSYASTKGKPIWCDKWPHTSVYLTQILEVFPDAKLICLYRDCLDTIASCLDAYGRLGFPMELARFVRMHPDNPVQAMATSWVEETARLLAIEQSEGARCHRIRYEDLVQKPESVLPAMFEFIGVAWEPEIVTRTFQVAHDGLGTRGDKSTVSKTTFDPSSIGKGTRSIEFRRLSRPTVSSANELLAKLGYPALEGRPFSQPVEAKRGVVQEALDQMIAQFVRNGMSQKLRSNGERVQDTGGIVKFVITDGKPGHWSVDFKGAEMTIRQDNPRPDVTVVMDQRMFLECAAGRTTVLQACRDGKVGYDDPKKMLGVVAFLL